MRTVQIQYQNSTPCKPKMNEATETANKSIKKKFSEHDHDLSGLAREAPICLSRLSYFFSFFTGTTSFSLVYDIEVVLPIEVDY